MNSSTAGDEALDDEIKPAKDEDTRFDKDFGGSNNELDKAEIDITDAEKELSEKITEFENGKQEYLDGEKELADFKEPSTFVLTRSENVGYSCFENDFKIVCRTYF